MAAAAMELPLPRARPPCPPPTVPRTQADGHTQAHAHTRSHTLHPATPFPSAVKERELEDLFYKVRSHARTPWCAELRVCARNGSDSASLLSGGGREQGWGPSESLLWSLHAHAC